MFAVFPSSVATAPAELKAAGESSSSTGFDVLKRFQEANKEHVSFEFGGQVALSYSHQKEVLGCPRQCAAIDDIFCLFIGNLENLAQLRQAYGLTKNVSEVQFVIEAYKVLRDRCPYKADQVVADIKGSFTFVLYDHVQKSMFMAADYSSKVPLFWGTSQDGSLSVSDDASLLKAACGLSFAPFPRGCLFSTKHGFQSWEHPGKELKPITHVDSRGQMCGANFRVDSSDDLTVVKDGAKQPEYNSWLGSF